MADLKDCYFFVDDSVPEEDRKMSVACVKCHVEKMPPDSGWFYRGSVDGYGPFNYKCELCGEMIHAGKDTSDDNEKETEATS